MMIIIIIIIITAICIAQNRLRATNMTLVQAEKDWRGVGRPQVAMHSQLPRFLVLQWLHAADIYTLCIGRTRWKVKAKRHAILLRDTA